MRRMLIEFLAPPMWLLPLKGLHHSGYFSGLFLVFSVSACWGLLGKDMQEYMDSSNFQCLQGLHIVSPGHTGCSPIVIESSWTLISVWVCLPQVSTCSSLIYLPAVKSWSFLRCRNGDLSSLVVQGKPYNLKLVELFFIVRVAAELLSTV